MATKEPAMRPTGTPVAEVLDRITGPRQLEAEQMMVLMSEVTDQDAAIWAHRIFGFGTYDYTYDSGHSGTAPVLGFATSSNKHTIYLANNFSELWPDLMAELGKYKASKACLYVSRLSDVDTGVLQQLLQNTVAWVNERYDSDVA